MSDFLQDKKSGTSSVKLKYNLIGTSHLFCAKHGPSMESKGSGLSALFWDTLYRLSNTNTLGDLLSIEMHCKCGKNRTQVLSTSGTDDAGATIWVN